MMLGMLFYVDSLSLNCLNKTHSTIITIVISPSGQTHAIHKLGVLQKEAGVGWCMEEPEGAVGRDLTKHSLLPSLNVSIPQTLLKY